MEPRRESNIAQKHFLITCTDLDSLHIVIRSHFLFACKLPSNATKSNGTKKMNLLFKTYVYKCMGNIKAQ